MGLLTTTEKLKKLTPTTLKNKGFQKIGWGAPDKYATFKPYSREFKTMPRWNPEHKCWEKIFEGSKDSGTIIYFQKGFSSYVTSFEGAPPSCTVMVMPNNYPNEIYKDIKTEMDLDILISKIEKKYKIYEFVY